MTAAINRIMGSRRCLLGAGDTTDPRALSLLQNLVLYAKLEDASLEVGPVASLTENNTPTYVAGKVNNALSIDGTNSLSVANASMGDLKVTGSFSVSCWFKTDGAGGFGENIASWYNFTGSQRAWWILYEGVNDKIMFDVSTDGTSTQPTNYLTCPITPLYGTHDPARWIFCVATYDDSTGIGVLNLDNGAQTATDTKSVAGVHQSTANFYIGRDGGGRNLAGDIDEFGFWNKVLSDSEISYLYNGGTGRTYPFT